MNTPDLVTREYPDCKMEFLRFQVGIHTLRPVQRPVYNDYGQVIGAENTNVLCRIFHVLGYGTSSRAAARMASHALAKLTSTPAKK